jgi:hypothetical protein
MQKSASGDKQQLKLSLYNVTYTVKIMKLFV